MTRLSELQSWPSHLPTFIAPSFYVRGLCAEMHERYFIVNLIHTKKIARFQENIACSQKCRYSGLYTMAKIALS